MELRVGKRLQGFAALLSRNVACALEVVQGKNVLQFWVAVNDRAVAVQFSLLQDVDQEVLEVLGLLVADDGGQVLFT